MECRAESACHATATSSLASFTPRLETAGWILRPEALFTVGLVGELGLVLRSKSTWDVLRTIRTSAHTACVPNARTITHLLESRGRDPALPGSPKASRKAASSSSKCATNLTSWKNRPSDSPEQKPSKSLSWLTHAAASSGSSHNGWRMMYE